MAEPVSIVKQQETQQLNNINHTSAEQETELIDASKANAVLKQLDTSPSSSTNTTEEATQLQQQQQKFNKIRVNQNDIELIKHEFNMDTNDATYQLRLANGDLQQCIHNLLQPNKQLLNKLQYQKQNNSITA